MGWGGANNTRKTLMSLLANRNSSVTSDNGLGRRKTARLQRGEGGTCLFSEHSFKRKERKWATAKEGYRTEKRFLF